MESKDQDTKASSENPMMMGMGMMKKMMEQMGSQKEGESDNPMQHMMTMCMGMCSEMLTAMHKTTSMAAFATPELHTLFGEWMEILENDALLVLNQQGEVDTATLASKLKISEESAIHLVAHLACKGKAVLSLRTLKGINEQD